MAGAGFGGVVLVACGGFGRPGGLGAPDWVAAAPVVAGGGCGPRGPGGGRREAAGGGGSGGGPVGQGREAAAGGGAVHDGSGGGADGGGSAAAGTLSSWKAADLTFQAHHLKENNYSLTVIGLPKTFDYDTYPLRPSVSDARLHTLRGFTQTRTGCSA